MKTVTGFPPNIETIRGKFPLSGTEIFTWGDTIYNPGGGELSPELQAHEAVHEKQQNGDPQAWWDRYMVDEPWRLEQELAAHKVEYRTYCKAHKDRNVQARFLVRIAQRLSSAMYGCIITAREASKLIRG